MLKTVVTNVYHDFKKIGHVNILLLYIHALGLKGHVYTVKFQELQPHLSVGESLLNYHSMYGITPKTAMIDHDNH